jgi:hypothetical protein
MAIDFDKFIKDHVIYYDPDFTIDKAISKIATNEWDIVAFRNMMHIRTNCKIPLLYRDVITNIKSEDAFLYYVIDNVDIPVDDDSKIITAFTPFKVIYLKAISDLTWISITFTRLLLKNEFVNELRKEIVYDTNFTYHGGVLI